MIHFDFFFDQRNRRTTSQQSAGGIGNSQYSVYFVHRFFAYLFEKANTVSVLKGDPGRTIGEGKWG